MPVVIEQGKTAKGGWTSAQLAILGETWPPKKGWRDRAIGREITQAQLDRFLDVARAKQPKLFDGLDATNAYGEPL